LSCAGAEYEDPIQPRSLWDPHPRYSQGLLVESGKILFIAGQTAVDGAGKIVGEGDIEAQTAMILQNIKTIVKKAGGSLKDLVATTSYVHRAS
jgi:2-iminobutanoate/2-iminopropanoate deaminase